MFCFFVFVFSFRNFKKENKSLLQGKPYSDQELNVDNKYQVKRLFR